LLARLKVECEKLRSVMCVTQFTRHGKRNTSFGYSNLSLDEAKQNAQGSIIWVTVIVTAVVSLS